MPNPPDQGFCDNLHLLRYLLSVWYGEDVNDVFRYMLRLKALRKETCKVSRMKIRLAGLLRTKNKEPGKKHEFAEFLNSLCLSDTQKLREKLELAKFRDSLGLSDIWMIIRYMKHQAPNRESHDLSFLLERIIYLVRNMAKDRPEHREKLDLVECYVYQLKEEQEVMSIVMSF
ncbi:hypothetical protein ACET3Z_013967 [Daucus carota]